MKRKKKSQHKHINEKPVHPTSSLNAYFMCECGRKYTQKINLIHHLSQCKGTVEPVVCHWCNLKFKNRGNLVTHAYYMHGDKNIKTVSNRVNSTQKKKLEHKCEACEAVFTERYKLKYHIRRKHFNLWARVPHAEEKRVNQVWFEKVLNTNLMVQIKKTGRNTLVLKPIPSDAGVKVHDTNRRVDLRSIYPIGRFHDELCTICLKIYRKQDLQKHMNEIHFNLAKHKCNNCNQTFKRSYIYLQHICHKVKTRGRKKKVPVEGVQQGTSSSIRITSVESLKPVEVD